MKVSPYTPTRPIILGDYGLDQPEPKTFPPLSEEQKLALQPASTQQLMKMKDDEPFIIGDQWKAPEIKIIEKRGPRGEFLALQVGEHIYTPVELDAVNFMRDARTQRDTSPFYRADKTSVIRPDNIKGDYEPGIPPWQKDLVASKLDHNTHVGLLKHEAQYSTKVQWRELSWWQALLHKVRGGEIRNESDEKNG